MRKATEVRKEPGEVIAVDRKRPRMCKRAEKLAGFEQGLEQRLEQGFEQGLATEILINVLPFTEGSIIFTVNGNSAFLDASDTVKTMIQEAWSETSKLRICVCYVDSTVSAVCLVK